MFEFEEGVSEILNPAIEKYERFFNSEFPLYEYIEITQSRDYDFSAKGAEKLVKLIDNRIRSDNPVEIPEGYESRLY
jgi:hypothetical protein